MAVNRSLIDFSTKEDLYFSQPRPEMMQYIPAVAKRILDVGCGEGVFGAQLKQRNQAEVWGIELEPAIAERAAKRLDKVLCGDVSQQLQSLPEEYFECAIFNDVLEHLADPYSVLRTIRQKLAPGGVIVCSIPNVRFFRNLFNLVVRGQWRYEEAGIMDKTHLRFFTKKSIREMFDSLNYHILKLEGINATPSWRVRLLMLGTFGLVNDTQYLQFACVAQPSLTTTSRANC
jgi:2-polyprenyl-3-methyl-5-hydroxy-6-metoxy-1,4-benzoquinol methylase